MAINFAQGNSSYLLGYVPKWTFSVVPGVFHEFTTEDLPDGKLPTQPRLGLLHREYPSDTASAAVPNGATTNGATNGANSTSNGLSSGTASEHETDYTQDWPRFAEHVRTLNREAPEGVAYKVLYLTRHGVGYHNQKSVEVGVEAWDVSHCHSPSSDSRPTDSHRTTGPSSTATASTTGSTPTSPPKASPKPAPSPSSTPPSSPATARPSPPPSTPAHSRAAFRPPTSPTGPSCPSPSAPS